MGRRVRVLIALLALLLVASIQPASAYGHEPEDIYITDAGLMDPVESVYLNLPVTWHNDATLPRQVSDELGVFDSGIMLPGGTFEWHPTAAGTFAYTSSFPLLGLFQEEGRLTVHPVYLPSSGIRYRLQWGLPGALPEGAVFEVQRQQNLSPRNWQDRRWVWWSRGTEAVTGRFVYRCNTGFFGIRVRIRAADGTRSGWAPSNGIACIP